MPDFAVAQLPIVNASPGPRASSPAQPANSSAPAENQGQDFSATLRQRLQAQAKPAAKASATQNQAASVQEPATPPADTKDIAAKATPNDAFLASLPIPAGLALASAKPVDSEANETSSSDTDHEAAPASGQDNTALMQSLAALAATTPANTPPHTAPGTTATADAGSNAEANRAAQTPAINADQARGRGENALAAAANLQKQDRQAANLASANTNETAKPAVINAASTNPGLAANAPAEAADTKTATATPFQVSLDAARQMQNAQNQATAQLHSGHPVSRSEAPVGSNAWNQDVADRVVWMVGQKESRADLVLNPPHLGRIEISVTVNGDQANATFVAANPNVRDALENALPRLREVLNDVGIQLGQANVGAGTPQFASQQGETGHNPASGRSRNDADSGLARGAESVLPASPARWQQQGTSLVDAFA